MSLIALLTDFGNCDYFVGAMKGVILSINDKAKIVDITHELEPQDINAASFTLRACFHNFPPKTIFVAVVDPGVGSSRKAILVETADYFFIAPDNGLLSFIFNSSDPETAGSKAPVPFRVFELTEDKYFNQNLSRTFHGRDIFAPVAAHLSKSMNPEVFGREIENFVALPENCPRPLSDGSIEAQIIHTDRFGNLITNLKRENLPEKFSIEFGGRRIQKLCDFFSEAEPGELFMIFGSAGFLELAVRNGSAARKLKFAENTKISVRNEL